MMQCYTIPQNTRDDTDRTKNKHTKILADVILEWWIYRWLLFWFLEISAFFKYFTNDTEKWGGERRMLLCCRELTLEAAVVPTSAPPWILPLGTPGLRGLVASREDEPELWQGNNCSQDCGLCGHLMTTSQEVVNCLASSNWQEISQDIHFNS